MMAAPLIAIGVWYAVSVWAGSYWVPSPTATFQRLLQDLVGGGLLLHAAYTTLETMFGLVTGAIPAVAVALLLRRRPFASAVLEPYMAAGYGLPKLTLAPILIVWFGIGMGPKIAVVAVSAFFIMYVHVWAGIRSVEPRLIHMARVAGATQWQVSRHVVLPSALPFILAGLRIALPYSVGGAIVVEMLTGNRGVGYVIQLAATNFDSRGVFAALALVGLGVGTGNAGVHLAECLLPRWHDAPPTVGSYVAG